MRRQFRQSQIGTVLRVRRMALNTLRENRLAAGFLTALVTRGAIGKANPERRFPKPRLDICPVPPADIGG